MKQLPRYDSLMLSVVDALQALGGTASNNEIGEYVFENLGLPVESKDQVLYRLVWARSYLRRNNVIHNLNRGLWSLDSTFIHSSLEEINVDF
jgi:restriction system protein